jgi:hypothetical protein
MPCSDRQGRGCLSKCTWEGRGGGERRMKSGRKFTDKKKKKLVGLGISGIPRRKSFGVGFTSHPFY